MFPLKCALLIQRIPDIKDGGFDNLALTAQAINAEIIPYDKIDYNDILKYQCIIIGDNKNYKLFDGIAQKVKSNNPKALLGWHQESEVSNIFRRHKLHGDKTSPEESFCIASLRVWQSIQFCDFVICHNDSDYSTSFYNIVSGNKPCFSLYPFLPTKKFKTYYKARKEKIKEIFLGFSYGWREGGLLSYFIAARPKYKNFKLIRRFRGVYPDSPLEQEVDKIIQNEFYKVPVHTHVGYDRIALAKLFARTYVAINLREPTASRTNALCAAVGTPMIGNEQSDVQRLLYPSLSINKYDLTEGDRLLDRLINDTDFYDSCAQYAFNKVEEVGIEASSTQLRENILKIWNNR